MDVISTLGLALMVIYVLVKEVIGPLVRKKPSVDTTTDLVPVRLSVLEVNLKTMESRIVEFRQLIERTGQAQDQASSALDNKMDIVLAELKEFREQVATRLTRVETEVETLLRGSRNG
jgi:hypothetical protein